MQEINRAAFRKAYRGIYRNKAWTCRQKRKMLQRLYSEHQISDEILLRRYRYLLYERDIKGNHLLGTFIGIIVGIFTSPMIEVLEWNVPGMTGWKAMIVLILAKMTAFVTIEVMTLAAVFFVLRVYHVRGYMQDDRIAVMPYEIRLLEEKLEVYKPQAAVAPSKIRKVRSSVMKKD